MLVLVYVLLEQFVFELNEKLYFLDKYIDFTVFLSLLVKSNKVYLNVKTQLQRIDIFTNDIINY